MIDQTSKSIEIPEGKEKDHPADWEDPCYDCGHFGERCERDPEKECVGWIPESARAALDGK